MPTELLKPAVAVCETLWVCDWAQAAWIPLQAGEAGAQLSHAGRSSVLQNPAEKRSNVGERQTAGHAEHIIPAFLPDGTVLSASGPAGKRSVLLFFLQSSVSPSA